ncbi:MAG TPA: nuclear transport factor 2 family protein [Longimicrobiales bacterium]|nr:nuclear transport factor 2 family protein [Longimicrobiales bacterium]
MARPIPRTPMPLLLGFLVLPCATAAQAPGYDQVDTRLLLAEYHAEVLEQVNRVMARWGAAWADDDLDRVLDTYWAEAVVIPPGRKPLRGAREIRAWLDEALSETGSIEAFMLDFDASGGMAVVYGNYLLEGPNGEQRTGPVVTVYSSRGRTWKIRSQVFMEG